MENDIRDIAIGVVNIMNVIGALTHDPFEDPAFDDGSNSTIRFNRKPAEKSDEVKERIRKNTELSRRFMLP